MARATKEKAPMTDGDIVKINFDTKFRERETFNAICRQDSRTVKDVCHSFVLDVIKRGTTHETSQGLEYPAAVLEAAHKLGMSVEAYVIDSALQRAKTVLDGDGTRGNATAKLAAKVAEIMAHNAKTPELYDRIEITMSLLSKKPSPTEPWGTGSNRQVIARYLEANASQIAAHHAKFDIEAGHNARAYHLRPK